MCKSSRYLQCNIVSVWGSNADMPSKGEMFLLEFLVFACLMPLVHSKQLPHILLLVYLLTTTVCPYWTHSWWCAAGQSASNVCTQPTQAHTLQTLTHVNPSVQFHNTLSTRPTHPHTHTCTHTHRGSISTRR